MAGCCVQTRRKHVPLAEVFAAFGLLNEARPLPGREGVFFDETTLCDVFFITLKKSERLFSPTTRYNDYAKCGGVTLPFLCLGFADYVSHEDERIWFVPEW